MKIMDSEVWVQLGGEILSFDEFGSHFGWSVDLNGDGTVLAVCANFAYTFQVFEWNGVEWVDKGELYGLIDDDFDYGDGAVVSLSDDGNTVAVGAEVNLMNSDITGYAKVFDWSGMSWVQRGSTFTGVESDDSYGAFVSLSSDGYRLAVGAPEWLGAVDYIGYVETYRWDDVNGYWFQYGSTIVGDDEFALDEAPITSMSLSGQGDKITIGRWFSNDFLRVYSINGTSSITDLKEIKFDVFPNPTLNFSKLTFSNYGDFYLIVTDSYGKNIISKQYQNVKELNIELPLISGIYRVQIIDMKDGASGFTSIIKL